MIITKETDYALRILRVLLDGENPLPLRSAQSRGPPDLLCPCIFPYQSS